MTFSKLLQPIRFIIQACFIAGLVVPFFPHPEMVAKYIFWSTLVVGVFFCGWVCPFGAAQDWLSWLARKLRLPRYQIPYRFQKFLQFSRYIWAALILFTGIHYAFLNARFYFNDNLFYGMLTWTSALTLAVFLLISLFSDRPFCNYFCMKGALDGLMSIIRPISIRRNNQTCIHCHLCDKACPMNVRVEHTPFVRHPNCINCFKCVSACPKNCLKFRLMSSPFQKSHKK